MSDSWNKGRAASNSSRTSCDDLSIEECERLVLSPPPVPMNIDEACAAIHAAACRSNSSRTHSVQTQLETWGDTCSHPSCQDLSKSNQERVPLGDGGRSEPTTSSWRILLCCFSARAKKRPSKNRSKSGEPASVEPTKYQRRFQFWSSKQATKDKNNISSFPENILTNPLCSHPEHDPSHPHLIDSDVTVNHPYRPVLPNIVLNALASNDQSYSSSPTDPTFCDKDARMSSNGASAQSSTKKNSFTMSMSRSSMLKHGAVDPNISTVDSSNEPSSQTRNFASPSTDHEKFAQNRFLPRTNHTNSWVGGDVMDHTPYESEAHTYSDLNSSGAHGDSSLENLETMTPGMDLLGIPTADCTSKKCLVLDLDETLVHSWFKYVDNASFIVPVELDGVKHQIYVCKRPHLDEFLRVVGPLFECVMFTASLRKYADPVCDYIDETLCFRHRLFREACVYHQNNLIKDLSRLGRDIDQICILDNSPVSFLFQPNNALQIVSWFDDPNDRALLELIPYLKGLAKSDTVVGYLREFQPPSSAAVAQPPTPSWLLLFNSGAQNESDENDGSEHLDDMGFDYSEEDAVLSPHFHPPLHAHSSNATALVRSYLTQISPHLNSQVTRHQITVIPASNSTASCIHQVTHPDLQHSGAVRLPTSVNLQNSQV